MQKGGALGAKAVEEVGFICKIIKRLSKNVKKSGGVDARILLVSVEAFEKSVPTDRYSAIRDNSASLNDANMNITP